MVSNGRPLCGTSVEDSLKIHRLLCNPRGLVKGASGTLFAIGHVLLQTSLDGPGLRRARGVAPLHSPPGVDPWTPVEARYRSSIGGQPRRSPLFSNAGVFPAPSSFSLSSSWLSMFPKLTGLIAATHTLLHDDRSLNLDVIPRQAEHLAATGVSAVFISGTTGESCSLTVEERLALTRRWIEVVRGTPLKLRRSRRAQLPGRRDGPGQSRPRGRCHRIVLAPSFFKPKNVDELVRFLEPPPARRPTSPSTTTTSRR